MSQIDRVAFRALALSLGTSERTLATVAKPSTLTTPATLTQAQLDRLASIARREAGAIRAGVSRLVMVRSAAPNTKAISEREAAGIVSRRIGRTFDLDRHEVLK